MADPTPEVVRDFWAYMSGHYESRVIKRSDALEMKVIAQALRLINAMDVKTFMTRFATTLGNRIYIPFTVGEVPDAEAEAWSLWDQITTAVHEHQHVYQYHKEGQTFVWKYLLRSSGRAHYEADAYRCNLEMHYWRYGYVPAGHKLAELLRAYKCNETDIAVAEKQFNLSSRTIEQGAIINDASRRAIGWLDANAPELREVV